MNIPRISAVILLTIIPLCLFSQTLDGRHAYRDGDILIRKEINPQSILWGDSGKLADLSQMEIFKGRYRKVVRKDSLGNIIVSDRFDSHSYAMRNDSVIRIQFENNQMKVEYDHPEVSCIYPLLLGDSIQGSFHGTGMYCGKWQIKQDGHYMTKADQTGYIILDNGDTLRHVIRLRTERILGTSPFPIDTVRNTNASSMDQTYNIPDMISTKTHGVNYCYYAKGYRYPVLESQLLTVVGKDAPSCHKVYYYPPEEQERLPLDETNILDRRMIEEGGHTSSPAPDKILKSYHVKQDAYSHALKIRYELLTTGKIQMILCDRSGIIHRRGNALGIKGKTGELSLDYNGIHPGVYILYVKAGNEIYSHKFNCQ